MIVGSAVARSIVVALLVTLLGSGAMGSPGHHNHARPWCKPTPAQRHAAAAFVEAVTAGIARFETVTMALAEGYVSDGPMTNAVMHYDSKEARRDGRILDPQRPESLVYANTYTGPKLLGALFTMAGTGGERGPRFGGCLTIWHKHHVCKTPAGASRPRVNGRCPPGTEKRTTNEMIHTWIVPMKGGPYAHRADDTYRCWLKPECL